jgi:hypothetical protein
MSSGVTRTVVGSVQSTGAVLQVKKVGFKPVRLRLQVGSVEGNWNEAMPDDSVLKRVTAGTGSVLTSNGVTPLSSGFELGADADLNPASATTIYYECEG